MTSTARYAGIAAGLTLAWALVLTLVLASGCDDGKRYTQAICVLADSSGTYTDELGEVSRVIKQALLPRLLPGDTLVLARIDSDSYERANLERAVTLDQRPSFANAQKAELAKSLAALVQHGRGARYTDIKGGIMLCREHLSETGAGSQVIVLFSDMQEELKAGQKRELGADELQGVRLVAMNVKRLGTDSADPTRYRERLHHWDTELRERGAKDFQVVIEPERLISYLDDSR